jgi:hypothetical protein
MNVVYKGSYRGHSVEMLIENENAIIKMDGVVIQTDKKSVMKNISGSGMLVDYIKMNVNTYLRVSESRKSFNELVKSLGWD